MTGSVNLCHTHHVFKAIGVTVFRLCKFPKIYIFHEISCLLSFMYQHHIPSYKTREKLV